MITIKTQLDPFSAITQNAHRFVSGPDSISCVWNGEKFWGWCALKLSITDWDHGAFEEIRSVYCDVTDEEQTVAIARVSSWHRNTLRKRFVDDEKNFQLQLPVRHTAMPRSNLFSWLELFQGVSIPLKLQIDEDITRVQRLRIETFYRQCMVEYAWQHNEDMKLNNLWQKVWDEHRATVQPESNVSDVIEKYHLPHLPEGIQ